MDVNEELVIIGESSLFDSLAFLDLVARIEEWMDETFELFVSLAGDEEDFNPDGPFGTVNSLAEYVTELVNRETVNQ